MQDPAQNINSNPAPVADPPVAAAPPQDPQAPFSQNGNSRPAFMTFEENGPSAQTSAPPASPAPPPPAAAPTDSVLFTPPVENSSSSGGGSSRKIAAILGLVVLLGATLAGAGLVVNQQLQTSQAWDCAQYQFRVSQEGAVSVLNGSSRNEPKQQAVVKVNNQVVATLEVPALNAGQSANLDTVPVPLGQGFTWEVRGSLDCQDGGSYTVTNTPIIQCTEVVAYDEDWNQLSASQLSARKSGDVIRFTASGSATSGTFDKARFTINGTLRPEVTTKKSTGEYYDEYTIPSGVTTFNVKAEIHHVETNKWY